MQFNLFQQLAISKEESEFEAYHSDNPQVYELFKKFTFKAISRKFKSYGAKAIFEIIRYETGVDTSGDEFKINNNYTPFYARLFMQDFPEHEGFFRTRASKADAA